jgi:mRNA interferase MazF
VARFIKGHIVIIPFPFSDLSGSKRRPAFVITELFGNDILRCQITSKASRDKYSIPLLSAQFKSGGLPIDSNVRPNKIFTADKSIIVRKAGIVDSHFVDEVIDAIVELNRS